MNADSLSSTGSLGLSAAHFNAPDVFIWLLTLIPIAAMMFFHYKRRFPLVARLVSRIDDPLSEKSAAARLIRVRYLASSLFFLLFIVSIITALAEPRIGSRMVREFRRGSDLVFAMDISRSMNVRDAGTIPGIILNRQSGSGEQQNTALSRTARQNETSTRLERAVWIAQKIIEDSADSATGSHPAFTANAMMIRFGLALGKGRGVLAVPVSADSQALLSLFDALSSSMVSARGTNLEQLIDAAAGGFLDNSPASRQIILFTDGENLSGSLSAALERASRKDITVLAVGVGSGYGALIPENGEERIGSNTVMTRSFLHSDALQNAVERSGGVYIDGNRDDAAKIIEQKIPPLTEKSSWVLREESGEIWHLFVILGLIFLALSLAVTQRPRGKQMKG